MQGLRKLNRKKRRPSNPFTLSQSDKVGSMKASYPVNNVVSAEEYEITLMMPGFSQGRSVCVEVIRSKFPAERTPLWLPNTVSDAAANS